MADVMDRWMRESINALEVMETRLAEHEQAVEAAMAAIRRHTEQIELLETHVKIVRDALSSAIENVEASPSGDVEVTVPAAQRPPTPPMQRPMLRPVPPPQPPQAWRVG